MSRETAQSVDIHSPDCVSAHSSPVLTSSPHRVGDHRKDKGSEGGGEEEERRIRNEKRSDERARG